MYFISDLKLVDSLSLELVILFAVAIGTLYDSIRANSELTASLSTTFATLSICLATASLNSSIALLVVAAASFFYYAANSGAYLICSDGDSYSFL
jgi:hypothetical protein